MKRKLVKRYMLLCLPFICGLFLYGIGLYGIVSSLLFFVGGYVLIKNIFDYRMVKKNIMKCIDNDKTTEIGTSDKDVVSGMLLEIDRDRVVNDRDILDDNSRNRYRYEYRGCDNICGLKNTRRYIKIRRRY